MDEEYDAIIANGTWRPATAEEIAKYEIICDGFSHVVSNDTTSCFCVRDKGSLQPLLLRGHTRAYTCVVVLFTNVRYKRWLLLHNHI
jgi:hypothetical protein